MRRWPIRWKLFAIPMGAVLLLAVASGMLFQSTRRYDHAVQSAVAAAINPSSAAPPHDPMLAATETAVAQALTQTSQSYADDRITLGACLTAALLGLLCAAWIEVTSVSRRIDKLRDAITLLVERGPAAADHAPAHDELEHLERRVHHGINRGRARAGRLRCSAEFLEFAQAAGGFGVFELDLVNGEVTGTPLFFELAGLKNPAAPLTREDWLATVHPEDTLAVVAALNAALGEGAGTFAAEYRTLRMDGDPQWLAARGQILKDTEGFPSRAVGTVKNITERKQREASLRYASDSLNFAQAVAGVATMDLDLGNKRFLTSANFHHILGIPSSTPLDDFEALIAAVHPEDRDRLRRTFTDTTPAHPSYRCEYRVRLPDGGERWVSEAAHCSHGRHGELTRITGSLVDVTHLKRTEAAPRSVGDRNPDTLGKRAPSPRVAGTNIHALPRAVAFPPEAAARTLALPELDDLVRRLASGSAP